MSDPSTNTQDRSEWRLRTYPAVVLVALIGALLLATVSYEQDHPTSRLGGDYPSFYGAGAIAWEGDWDELYSAERQQSEQAGLIDDEGGYLYFSYPPFVAGAYGLLAAIGYQASFLIHTLLLGIALFAAVRLMWPWLQRLGWPLVAVGVVALAFYPVLRAIPGGQNTTISMLLFALALRLDHDDRPMLAGLAAALILFKPQFGLVIVLLVIVGRRWRMLAGWGIGALSLYAVSALLMGGEWIRDWWTQAGSFRDLNLEANGANFVSFPGFLENAFGLGSSAAWLIGYSLAALVGAAVALFWWRHPRDRSLERWSLAAAAVVVSAPQTLYYDTGLLLFGLVVFLASSRARASALVGSAVAVSWTQVAASALGWSPLGPVAWAAVAALLCRVYQCRGLDSAAIGSD